MVIGSEGAGFGPPEELLGRCHRKTRGTADTDREPDPFVPSGQSLALSLVERGNSGQGLSIVCEIGSCVYLRDLDSVMGESPLVEYI